MKKRFKTIALAALTLAALGSLIWFSFGPMQPAPLTQESIEMENTLSVLP